MKHTKFRWSGLMIREGFSPSLTIWWWPLNKFFFALILGKRSYYFGNEGGWWGEMEGLDAT